jgi:hypothetical protein
MTKKMLLILCLSLLSGATAQAQRQARQSPFMQEFGAVVARQERLDRARPPKSHPLRDVPVNTTDELNRALAAQGPLVPWAPSQQKLQAISVNELLGGDDRLAARAASLRNFNSPVATAAASRPKTVTRKLDADRLLVRAGNPGSWNVGALEKKNGDSFTIRAISGDYDFGDSHGDVELKGVYVLRNGLAGGSLKSVKGNPPPAIRDHDASRAYLKKKYASWVSPGVSDGQLVTLSERAGLYDSYDPKTKKLLGHVKTLDPTTPNREVRVRWITKDGKGAVVRYSGLDKNGDPTKLTQWGYVPCSKLRGTNGRTVQCK